MKKILITFAVSLMTVLTCQAQYSTTYSDIYGRTTGTATTRSNYGGGTTTTYSDNYGRTTGTATTRSNYGGGTTTTYYDTYGRVIGTSTRR